MGHHKLRVDFDTGVVAVEIDPITENDAGRYQAAFVTPLGMFDTRVNYDFQGDLFKAIMRKALDLKDDEAYEKDKKNKKSQEPQTQEIVVEEEEEDSDVEMLACFKSPYVQYKREESGQLQLYIEVDNKQDNTRVKWYKDSAELEDTASSEYHIGESNVAIYFPDFSICSGEYVVELCEGSNSLQSMLLDLTGATFDGLFEK